MFHRISGNGRWLGRTCLQYRLARGAAGGLHLGWGTWPDLPLDVPYISALRLVGDSLQVGDLIPQNLVVTRTDEQWW